MPIYAYKCTACGHAQDVLQKISDKPLTVCPECNQETYAKQVTAAGFQLKGSGWYVTDFRNNSGGGAKTAEVAPAVTAADKAASEKGSGDSGGSKETGSDAGSSKQAGGSATGSSAGSSESGSSATVAAPASSNQPATGGSASSGSAA
ncbi:FmdB family zinc ribbon protein [Zwartia sp.]|uniref:FmdB family zinc ribbon protein n=1 Tax=Zwartia sp. TaxID=2978004 RepID=UPI002722FB67|nr:FmdB family zinc ribbon protein [Zwartia sp.]MDO9023574.1 zinc ribbon domain-containing protein [Zwartia sp.]